MRRLIIKFTVFAIALSIFTLLLVSCGGLERDKVVSIASELIEKSYEINEIFYGEGLPLKEKSLEAVEENAESGLYADVLIPPYVEVDSSCGYLYIDQMKAAALAVYTEDYCTGMFEYAFEGMNDALGNTLYYARYIENDYGALAMKYEFTKTTYDLSRTYDMDSLKVDKQTSSYILFTVDSYVDGALSDPVQLKIVHTSSGWRLDTPTY